MANLPFTDSSGESNDNSTYFAAKPSRDVAETLEVRAAEWNNALGSNGHLDKLRKSYDAFHGFFYNEGHSISFSGDQGELVNFPINQYSNIAVHMITMTVSNRPSMDCRATNTDYKSLVQTYLANNILDYYMREKKLEIFLKTAVEYAVVYGAGFVTMEWDATKGEVVDYIEDTQTKIYEGDIVFGNLSPFDVLYDGTKETPNDNEWVLIRKWRNKYDLAAKYPEFGDKLKALETKSDTATYRLGFGLLNQSTDDVEVLEFYHKKTPALPNGRYMMFCSSDIVLQDLAMPYRILPVFRIAPRNIHGTPWGYTPMFDLLPLQDALNSTYSTILTNQSAFGVQNVLNPRGTDISVQQLAGGLNVIDYNAAAGKPEPLNLTATPAEVFKMAEIIQQQMELISGINSVARGQPEPSLKSGTALALVQSMALQFISGLQQSYVELIEGVGTAIIKMLQDFAATPRMIAIAGKSNRSFMKEFTSEDISNIARVVVDVGNPMARTTAGRVQMAEQLLQYGKCTPDQYIQLIHTGNLNAITETVVHEEFLMKAENEDLIDGKTPQAIFTEQHKEHIDSHRSVLFDPELKLDMDLVGRVQAHIQQHLGLLRTTDPALLQLMGQQPLPPLPQPGAPPMGPPPGGPGGPPPEQQQPQGPPPHPQHVIHHQAPPAHQSMSSMAPPEQGLLGPGVMGGRLIGPGIAPGGQRLPSIAKVPGNLLPNAALQQQSLNNVK